MTGNLGRLVLPDYHPFVPIVGRAYMARPAYQADVVYSWRALAAHTEHMFQQLLSRIRVEFVSRDAYAGNFLVMRDDIAKNRRLKVWTGESKHGVFTPEQNWKFRAVHDYMTHFSGEHAFTLRGEMSAYNRHVKTLPPAARLALFTEVVGQVCTYFFLNKKFPPQKVAGLYGFDYVNVGSWDPVTYKKNFR
jgi:hypothetical protein